MSSGSLGYQRFGIVCVVVVYLLILVGGIVRSTGAGMGCPDWPTCFGRIIPPTKESELPADYQVKYRNHGYGTAKFNAVKTWTEYLNRLLGAVTGLLLIILFVISLSYRKRDRSITWLTGITLFLVILEGVIGMLVVKMNLEGSTVTVHFWGSVAIILLLIYSLSRSRKSDLTVSGIQEAEQLKGLILLIMGLTAIQVVLGTQVRQQVEKISIELNYSQRESWIDRLSPVFYVHRSFSILLLAVHVFFVYRVRKSVSGSNILSQVTVLLLGVLFAEITAGIVLNYLHVPAVAQPVHMLLGPLLLGIQFFLFTILNFSIQYNKYGRYSPAKA